MVEYLVIGLLIGYIVGGGNIKLKFRRRKPSEATESQKKFQAHFDGLMNYDVNQAYGKLGK